MGMVKGVTRINFLQHSPLSYFLGRNSCSEPTSKVNYRPISVVPANVQGFRALFRKTGSSFYWNCCWHGLSGFVEDM